MTRAKLFAVLVACLAGTALAPAPASAQAGAPAACPGTFEVLHNDRIGSLSLPAGAYVITVLDSAELSCSDASELFTQFLQDWDGRLPRPWVIDVASASFRRGDSSIGFSVAQSSPTPPAPPSRRVCPGYFTVLHNDHIGAFAIRAGRYRITLLSVSRFSCSQASRALARFLQDYDGVLPRPWFLDPSTGTFARGSLHVGFRIKPYVPDGGGGGGRHPSGETRCPTFRVLNNDSIGALRLARGVYNVWVRGGLSCPASTTLFASFLQDFDGVLPRPWVLNVRTASFSRGRGSEVGFRVKPVR